MKHAIIICIPVISGILFASPPDGNLLLRQIDENLFSKNKVITSKMIIHGRRGSRTLESRSWIQGTEKSFTEYLAPARDRGTKMLKLNDQLWTYTPSADRIIRISGHMLRQSVMGSDLSYEDMLEDPRLQNLYDAAVVGEDTLLSRPCWILELKAKVPDVAYHHRKMWVDKSRYTILREERFAKSGKMLKTTDVREIMKTDNRWVAKRVVFKDVLKTGQGTEFILIDVLFDTDIPPNIFSKAALRQ